MRRIVICILMILGLLSSPALGVSPETIHSLTERLARWDVEEAWQEIQGLLGAEGKDPQLLELASKMACVRGEYQEGKRLMKSAIERGGGEDEQKKAFFLFIEETIGVLEPFKKFESPHFVITLDEKQDGILVPYLIDGLEKTYRAMAKQYGFQPQEKIRVEIFPDTRAFYFASTLSARDIEVAGAVGLANFNKLMVLSPKALVYGYRWLDALSHEYMHYLIIKLTSNRAPIWFHEGLAKLEETRWRNGPSYLTPLNQTLLASALKQGKLIGFERMEPSLLKLETPEEVQLAYAQAASAIEFILTQAGHEGLKQIMVQMAKSSQRGASEAIQNVLALSFPEFQRQWQKALSARGLTEVEGVNVRPYKIKEGKADEERLDMKEIKSLVARNRAHLGDRLKERGRMEAAAAEYRRALAEVQNSVPILNRLAEVLIKMGRDQEALELLQRAKEIAPDHPTLYNQMGEIYLRLRNFGKAREVLEDSIQINPFNPEVHRNLAEAYEMLGDGSSAVKEREIAKKIGR